jgi:hypothetical protein
MAGYKDSINKALYQPFVEDNFEEPPNPISGAHKPEDPQYYRPDCRGSPFQTRRISCVVITYEVVMGIGSMIAQEDGDQYGMANSQSGWRRKKNFGSQIEFFVFVPRPARLCVKIAKQMPEVDIDK